MPFTVEKVGADVSQRCSYIQRGQSSTRRKLIAWLASRSRVRSGATSNQADTNPKLAGKCVVPALTLR